MTIHEDRIFSPNPDIRKIAKQLYSQVKDQPIISPHGHVPPQLFAGNKPFPDPAELLIIPDHYVLRMLYSQGISLESLGIPSFGGGDAEQDHRKIWQRFAENFYLFAGTPSGMWLNVEMEEVFGVTDKLNGHNAQEIYDFIQEKLQMSEFLPRAMFEKFNIEVLTTTDGASDSLEFHHQIRESGWTGDVRPCFRPDAVVNIDHSGWIEEIHKLGDSVGYEITDFKTYIRALEKRRDFFKTMGATSTDQGVEFPYTGKLLYFEADGIFQRALKGAADRNDAKRFTGHMLMEMARMSCEDGLVMQIHAGVTRNHNKLIYKKHGPDKGGDLPVQTEFVNNLKPLLNEFGNDPRFTLVVFTLDETTYSRELAPLAGHYPAMKLGASWWFHDSINGMTRFREQITETAGIYNTVGFTDDTRAFPSIPARHDVSRRVDANFLAGLVARHIIDMDDAEKMIRALTYELPKKTYKLG